MYTAAQRWLHWTVALLVGGQYLLQNAMHRAMERLGSGAGIDAAGFLVTTWHSLAGLAIGVCMLWRWLLRRRQATPAGAVGGPRWQRQLAGINHALLYLTVALMVISGLLNYYAELTLAGRVHAIGKWLLGLLVALHVSAALWHHFVRRDAVLRNMLVSGRHADTIPGD